MQSSRACCSLAIPLSSLLSSSKVITSSNKPLPFGHSCPFVMQSTTPKPLSPRRHEHYYFKDGNVIFLVENTLFNVHRYFLQRDSKVFQDLFSLPQGTVVEGSSDDQPILLEDTKSVDMERFLSTLYPRRVGKYDLKTTEEWSSVIKLAYKWQFDAICELVAERLPHVASLADQIVLARRYNLSDLLLAARVKICEREAPLTLEEGRLLGVDECIVIGEVRQQARCNMYATSAMKFDEWDIRRLQKSFKVLDGC